MSGPDVPDPVIVSASDLQEVVERLLVSAGVPARAAWLVADSLVAANLRGVDSHGVQLLYSYLEQLAAGEVSPCFEGRVISEEGACLLYDAGHGLGQVTSEICCAHAIRLAREHGVSLVVAREACHFGMAAYWAERISGAGLIGIVLCNASPLVPPWQGKDGRLGTNPICMAVPAGDRKGWLLDMATTTVAVGKIYKAALAGSPSIPLGWAMDAEGAPTTDTQAALRGLLVPLGGYKGSGLAMLVEVLCAVLGGGAISTEVGGIRVRGRPMRVSHAFLAIDVARFLPLEEFQERLGRLVDRIKSARPAPGYDEVLVAGEPEWRMEEQRRRHGIPLPATLWNDLCAAASPKRDE